MAFGPLKNFGLKIKRFTGTTPNVQGLTITITDVGINSAQILILSGIVHYESGGIIPPSYESLPNYQYNIWMGQGSLHLNVVTNNSALILNKPFSIFVVYT